MIIVRTPFRVSFVGGGTDLPYFYEQHGGCVVSMAIDKYSYLSLHPNFHGKGHLIKYSNVENTDSIDQIKHPIIRTVFEMYGIDGVDFSSASDIPAGTGLASSSAFTCGLLRLCDTYQGNNRTQLDLAAAACDVEINRLREPIGKQDQYGCAIPGLKTISFGRDGSVEVSPILLTQSAQTRLEESLLLIYCGGQRSASAQLKTQEKHVASSDDLTTNLIEMADQARDLSRRIALDPDCLGEFLRDGWERKKRLSPGMSTPEIDAAHDRAIAAGATGGKLLGAGGAGFLLMHVPDCRDAVIAALPDYQTMPIRMDMRGSIVIHQDGHVR